ncbi:MAG: FMN-binding protein [Reichenbachiella sp.]
MKSATIITLVFLLLAALAEWVVDQKSTNHVIAETYIGECKTVTFPGADAFQSSTKTAILFRSKGFQGPIETLIVISDDAIEKVVMLKSNEGLDKSVLNDPDFLASFKRSIHDLPIDVDAVSSATISSQIVIDEMNRHIKEWNKRND